MMSNVGERGISFSSFLCSRNRMKKKRKNVHLKSLRSLHKTKPIHSRKNNQKIKQKRNLCSKFLTHLQKIKIIKRWNSGYIPPGYTCVGISITGYINLSTFAQLSTKRNKFEICSHIAKKITYQGNYRKYIRINSRAQGVG